MVTFFKMILREFLINGKRVQEVGALSDIMERKIDMKALEFNSNSALNNKVAILKL
jgi:hypothetical protein